MRAHFLKIFILAFGLVLFGLVFQEGYFAPKAMASDHGEKKAEHSGEKKSKKGRPKKKSKDEKKKEAEFENKVGEKGASHADLDAKLQDEAKVDALLLLDSSGSMLRTDPKRLRDQAARLFSRFLGDKDRISIFQFDQEVKRLSEFTEINAESVKTLDEALHSMTSEGRFTDLELALETPIETFPAEARPDAKKIVILLSDGKMDPHPSRGTAEALSDKLFNEILPRYRSARIAVYTVSLSAEADRELLGKIAKETEGQELEATDVQTVHKRFSELYLSLKRPQVVSAEHGGFEIDGSVQEATFYISRKDPNQEISLVSPNHEKMSNLEFPVGVRWYRGELFDVITIKKPAVGSWQIIGVEQPDGFATLLTDLKLQVQFSKTSLNIGDSQSVVARLTTDGKVFAEPGLTEITAYLYKVVSASGEIVAQGPLNDKGEQGDETAGDGIYSTTVKATTEGEFKLMVGAASATFSRQQIIPFEVSRGAIEMKLVHADEFSHSKERFEIALTEKGKKLKTPEIELLTKSEASGKILAYKLQPKEDGSYSFDSEKLQPGKYVVTARISGKNAKTGEIERSNSEKIEYEAVKPAVDELQPDAVIDDEHAESVEPTVSSGIYLNIASLVLAMLWAGGLVYYFIKFLDVSANLPPIEAAYEQPSELKEKIAAIKSKRSSQSRPATSNEHEIFELVKESLPAINKDSSAEAS